MSAYRFARSPRWIASHLLVLVVIATCVSLGLWQLRRLDERRDANAVVESRTAQPVVAIDEAVGADDRFEVGESVDFRRVTATGRWDPGEGLLVRGRTQDGRPGVHLLTPLVTGDGVAVLVNRGFLPSQGTPDALPAEANVDADVDVTVTGLLRATQRREGLGQRDPAEGVLATVARVDVERIQEQVAVDLYPVWLQLEALTPPDPDGFPIPLPPPELSERNHLSYAFQWFSFATIAAVGYPLILRRRARTGEPSREPSDA